MQLKSEDNNNNQQQVPFINGQHPPYNGQPQQGGYNQQPQPPYNAQPQSPYGNVQPQSPYSNAQPQHSPYNNPQPQQPYNNGQPQSPYNGQPQQGGYNQQPYNNPQQGAYPYNGPAQSNYNDVVIRQKSGFPTWAIILIVLLVLGCAGYFVFGKFSSIFGKADYTPGMVSDNVYTNEFFGFKVNFGSGWKIKKDVYDAELVKKSLDAKQVVTEVSAQNDKSIEAFGFTVQQTPYNIKAVGTDMDQLMESMKSTFVTEMEQQGYKITSIERETMTIAGKTCEGFRMTGKVDGISIEMSLVQFYVFKDNYVGAFSAASTSEGKCKLIISNNVKALTD